jgi:hypothetical protein
MPFIYRRDAYKFLSGWHIENRATKQFSSGGVWAGADTHYYRYYKVGEMSGFAYALKYIIEPAVLPQPSPIR